MKIDTFYRAARGKRESQDYVIHDESNIVLCDGCSSSPFTEIGSRLLAHSALTLIKDYNEPVYSPRDIVEDAMTAAAVVGLPETALDCTLLTVRVRNDITYVNCFGDGAVVYDGNIVTLKYSGNAPYYPSYMLNRERHEEWVKGEYKLMANGLELTHPRFHLTLLNFKELAIFSDGIEQFEDKTNLQVIRETFALMLRNGKFLQRRCNHISEKHNDDFSVGMILNEINH